LNWIVKDKILAFAGPSFERHVSPEGYCTLAPADYIPYFQQKNVGLVVRLNKKFYNEQDFVDAGIDHLEAFFLDGSCPSLDILHGVLDAFEQVPEGKAFAVHCKAGLGRTGCCIGAYLMKHYGFTAKEVIAWMRICRPGMVIGPQQQYMEKIQHLMWEEGVAAGYIEMPMESSESSSVKVETIQETAAPQTTPPRNRRNAAVDDADMPDAVTGRAGQGESLLAARTRRSVHNNPTAASSAAAAAAAGESMMTTSTTPSTPVTPEQPGRGKAAVTVTPEAQTAGTTLWCG